MALGMKHRYYSLLLACCGTLALLPGAWAQKVAPLPANAPVQTARTELPLNERDSEVHVQALPADSSVVLLVGREHALSSRTDFSFQRVIPDGESVPSTTFAKRQCLAVSAP